MENIEAGGTGLLFMISTITVYQYNACKRDVSAQTTQVVRYMIDVSSSRKVAINSGMLKHNS